MSLSMLAIPYVCVVATSADAGDIGGTIRSGGWTDICQAEKAAVVLQALHR